MGGTGRGCPGRSARARLATNSGSSASAALRFTSSRSAPAVSLWPVGQPASWASCCRVSLCPRGSRSPALSCHSPAGDRTLHRHVEPGLGAEPSLPLRPRRASFSFLIPARAPGAHSGFAVSLSSSDPLGTGLGAPPYDRMADSLSFCHCCIPRKPGSRQRRMMGRERGERVCLRDRVPCPGSGFRSLERRLSQGGRSSASQAGLFLRGLRLPPVRQPLDRTPRRRAGPVLRVRRKRDEAGRVALTAR